MSLRARLLIAIGVVALVALLIADFVTYSALQSFLYQRVDQQLTTSHTYFEQAIDSGRGYPCFTGSNRSFPSPPQGTGQGPGGGASSAFQLQAVELRTTSGNLVPGSSCPVYIDDRAYLPQISGPITGFANGPDGTRAAFFDAPTVPSGGPTLRVRAEKIANGDVLVVAQPLIDTESTLNQLRVIELIVTAGAVLLALAAGYWLVRIGLRPLRDMETAAESIAEGNLTERVPGEDDSTEVGRLARTLNIMLARIEGAFRARVASEERLRESDARLRRFVGDASHELRTPIAAISAYAELFGRGASEHQGDLERLMVGIRTETGRMEHLVADLLLLARLDEGRPMELHSVDLTALCGQAVQTSTAVGPDWPVSFSAPRPIEVVGDATSLRQVVDNLLGNVRSHTPAGTTARVSVEPDGDGAVIVVSDDGPGMDPDQVSHVFERFYRSDPSRSRLHGGAGLGLSIVAAIVAAHGGTVTATSAPGHGTTFTVRLPAAPPAAPVTSPSAGDATAVGPVEPVGSVGPVEPVGSVGPVEPVNGPVSAPGGDSPAAPPADAGPVAGPD